MRNGGCCGVSVVQCARSVLLVGMGVASLAACELSGTGEANPPSDSSRSSSPDESAPDAGGVERGIDGGGTWGTSADAAQIDLDLQGTHPDAASEPDMSSVTTSHDDSTHDVSGTGGPAWGDASDGRDPSSGADGTSSPGEVSIDLILVNDDSTDTTDSPPDDAGDTEPPALEVAVTSRADWVDLPAEFSADISSTSTLPAIQWRLVSAPEGSNVTFTGETEATLVFYPDRAGTYVAEVTVTVDEQMQVATGSVEVEAVEVGYVALSQGQGSNVYVNTPRMVTSDGQVDVAVGCAYDTSGLDTVGLYGWTSEYWSGRQVLGFRYPASVGERTQMAYRWRTPNQPLGFTHVATAQNDCENSPPAGGAPALSPTFSPDGKRLLYLNEQTNEVETVGAGGDELRAMPAQPNVRTLAWPSDTRVAGDRYAQDGDFGYGLWTVPDAVGQTASALLTCTDGNDEFYFPFEQFYVLPERLLLLEYTGELWSVARGDGSASCTRSSPGNQLLMTGVRALAPAPDGMRLAVIVEEYSQDTGAQQFALRIGPAADATDVTVTLEPGREHFGLHWIAGSKQLAWTELRQDYAQDASGNFTDLYEAVLWRINADGTRKTELAREVSDATQQRLLLTGPVSNGNDG